MLAFLARLGRKPWTKAVTPLISCSVGTIYLYLHTYGHDKLREQFIARDHLGYPKLLSDDIKNLVLKVYEDVKNQYSQPIISNSKYNNENPIKWFTSATLDPISFGMSEARQGSLIGLPETFSKQSTREIPDELITLKKIRIFRKSFKPQEDEKEPDETFKLIEPWLVKYDRKNPNVNDFLESLILSEKAKKFAIARELFHTDTYRVFIVSLAMFMAPLAALAMSRYLISSRAALKTNIKRRLPLYATVGFLSIANYCFISDMINRSFIFEADKRAISVSEEYKQGGIEYLNKLLDRNIAMKNLFDDAKDSFNDEGEPIQIYRKKYPSIKERIRQIECHINDPAPS